MILIKNKDDRIIKSKTKNQMIRFNNKNKEYQGIDIDA